MWDIDFKIIKKVFFVGIGGIGISAIARMMLLEGKEVIGSDISDSEIIGELKKLGAKIILGQGMELIPKDIHLIVYSIAIEKYDPQFFAELKNLRTYLLSYPEILGLVTRDKYTIAVAGTHGKTTTTAMVGKVLIDTKHDPSIVVGSLLKDYKSNLVVGKSNFFVVEACEYERSFLCIKPKILIITNIDIEHLDYYKNLRDIQDAFEQLILETEHLVIYNGQDINTSVLIAKYINRGPKSGVVDYAKYIDKVPKLSVPGLHNRINAAAAMAVADILNIKEEDAQKSLAEFPGTWRRLEKRGETPEGAIIYDDYSHHPTEIRAAIQALRELYPKGDKRLIILFQPHLYSRTKALFNDFAKSFKGADKIFLVPIYFAREHNDGSVSSDKLAYAIREEGEDAQAYPNFESAENAVLALHLGPNDVFITMGAGEAYKVADKVFKLL